MVKKTITRTRFTYVTDTEKFGKTVKQIFGNKVKTCNTIFTVITSEIALAKIFN